MNYTKYISKIIDNLYLGSWHATKKCILDEYEIKSVVSIGCDPYSEHQKGIGYFYFDVEDNIQSASKLFDQILPEILPLVENLKNKGNVLIHCSAGKSRSVTIVAAYLIQYKFMSAKGAIEYIREKRDCIRPNDGFIDGLTNFQKSLF